MTDKIVVLNTCPSREEAEKIGRLLVEKRLAACVNVIPNLRSFYWWQNEVQDDEEWLLVIKTKRQLFDELRKTIEKEHSYTVPEVIALPVVEGAEAYLSWLDREVRAESEG